jgi:hypothetical protein
MPTTIADRTLSIDFPPHFSFSGSNAIRWRRNRPVHTGCVPRNVALDYIVAMGYKQP